MKPLICGELYDISLYRGRQCGLCYYCVGNASLLESSRLLLRLSYLKDTHLTHARRKVDSTLLEFANMSPALVSDLVVAHEAPEPDHSDAAGLSSERLFRLRDKTMMITGAGRGLGPSLAYAVLETGADVCCFDVLKEPDSEEWANAKKREKGWELLYISYNRCDITNETTVE